MFVITGGGGFIGSNLAAHLESRYTDPIVICDHFGLTDKWKNLSQRRLYDVISPAQFPAFLEQYKDTITTIFHMGAISTTTERDVDLVLENNLRLSKSLLNWCGENRIRLIYASSAATYGDGKQGFNDASDLDSLLKLRPMNPYAWSKHLFDLTLAQIRQGYAHETTLPPQVVGLKFFNVYGPNEYHKGGQMSLVPQFFKQIQETDSVCLFKSTVSQFGDGEQLRDFIHVDDCASVMLWFYEHPEQSGLYNVGTGQARSFNDLAIAVFRSLNRDPNITYVDMPESLKKQYQSYTQANIQQLLAAGYDQPFISLERGVTDYVQRFLTQETPYR